jgi:hypothetical protein
MSLDLPANLPNLPEASESVGLWGRALDKDTALSLEKGDIDCPVADNSPRGRLYRLASTIYHSMNSNKLEDRKELPMRLRGKRDGRELRSASRLQKTQYEDSLVCLSVRISQRVRVWLMISAHSSIDQSSLLRMGRSHQTSFNHPRTLPHLQAILPLRDVRRFPSRELYRQT